MNGSTATGPTGAAPLPDVNAETYPYEFVQQLLDQTATFVWYATPVPGFFQRASLTPDDSADYFGINGGYGIALSCDLHPFDSRPDPSGDGPRLAITQVAGAPVAQLRCIALFAPDSDPDTRWQPTQNPRPAIFDRWRSQRVVLSNVTVTFSSGDEIRAFGLGRTYPSGSDRDPRLLLGGVVNMTRGVGVFENHEGSIALCGNIDAELGFEGVITCRVPDPYGDLRVDETPDVDSEIDLSRADTFLVIRGQKKDRTVRTTFGPKPGPGLDSLITPSEMLGVQYGMTRPGRHPRASMAIGPLVARMNADVHFDLSAPAGTATKPGNFTTREEYAFVAGDSRRSAMLSARVDEGISFGLAFPAAPGQPGIRFAGYGPIVSGTGAFASIEGLLTVNSVIGIAPHALSLTHVLHFVDRSGRFHVSQ